MKTVIWSKKTDRQIQGIFEYYRSVAGETIARRIVQDIYAKHKYLATHPYIGRREPLLEDRPEEYRRLISGNYKIIYRIENDVVRVSSVFDTRRDPAALRRSVVEED